MNTKDLIIEAGRTESQYWQDLWRYRELFYFLAWRDIIVRYKQTAIGIAWALIQPFLTMVVFTLVFSRVANLPSKGLPYPILVIAGILPWQFFSTALTECSNSLLNNTNLISKIYFPRLIVPASSVIVCFVNFLISAMLLIAMFAWYDFIPDWRILTLPLFILIAFAASMGVGLWLAALNVEYRDFRFVVPFIVQLGIYVSPVGYISEVIYDKYPKWRLLYCLNPMVGVIDGFRWAISRGTFEVYLPGFAVSIGVVILFLISGIWFFRKTERTFADVI